MASAISGGVDAALLDVNIAGEFAYPLADQLRDQGIPVIFVTGYQAGAIEPRFSECPVLTKPVDRDDLAIALARTVAGTVGRPEEVVSSPQS